ncbi:MAG TPA: prepilin-type N-terminal cleavage/methylation domain-containing protein [Candidatus Sulfotelmatobacter sp.]|nr:prepilin-type N-terminal cleavage/methylation domain-containing protein [Candidatus Sulfotelmatobacter sp.]
MTQCSSSRTTHPSRSRGFTLIELLVVIAIIAILAAILLPVLSKAQRNSLRTVDINNMKQMAAASFMYASDFNDWLPVSTLGSGNDSPTIVDILQGIHYTRYIAINPVYGNPALTPNMQIPQNYEPYDQNMGLLYGGGQIQNANVFFCPLLQDPLLSPSQYSTPRFLSSDSGGVVRSPYMYNPRVVSAGLPGEPPQNLERKYEKTTDVHQMDVFILDYMAPESTNANPDATTSPTGVPFDIQDWPQWPSAGTEVTFTDGSVSYANLTPLMPLITTKLVATETAASYEGYDEIFSYIQSQP